MKFPEMASEEFVELVKRWGFFNQIHHSAYRHTYQKVYEIEVHPEDLIELLAAPIGEPGYMTKVQMEVLLQRVIEKYIPVEESPESVRVITRNLEEYRLMTKSSRAAAWLAVHALMDYLTYKRHIWWPIACHEVSQSIREIVNELEEQ